MNNFDVDIHSGVHEAEAEYTTKMHFALLAEEGFHYNELEQTHSLTMEVRNTYTIKVYIADTKQIDLIIFPHEDITNILLAKTFLFTTQTFANAYARTIAEIQNFFSIPDQEEFQ